MKKLYYIEQEVFLRDLLDELCKQNPEFQCYSSEDGRNSLYFFQDLRPDIIVVDWATISSYETDLFAELAQVADIPLALTHDPSVELPENWKQRSKVILKKPIVAMELLKNLFS